MNPKYFPLSHDASALDDGEIEKADRGRRHLNSLCKSIIVIVLVITTFSFSAVTLRTLREKSIPSDYAKVDPLAPTWTRFWWNTAYSPKNHSESDALWEAILPSHGFVAMDRKWAASRHWPETMYLPSDDSKGVYLLEAYHQIHCLRIIRKTFWEAVEHRPFTYHPSIHMEHCFDTLRQSVQCNADNTPLYTFGDKTAGDGQLHRCRDWNELRDFATEHSACYRDTVEDVLLRDHFGFCDQGSDGLIGSD